MARLAIVALLITLLGCHANAQQVGGATSAKDLVTLLINNYNAGAGSNLPAYSSVGSTGGVNGFISGTYAIGSSDYPLSPAQYSQAKARGITAGTIPFTLATYSVVHNVGGFSLKGCQIANIYLGKITNWNQIPGSKRSGTIVPLMRNSGSGTTDVFTTYLKKSCPSWPSAFVGSGPFDTGNPNLKKVSGSDGMSSTVASDNNAIGYTQTSFGVSKYKNKEIPIQNKAGKLVTAGSTDPYQSIPRTLPTTYKSWSGVDLIYKPGSKTFPIVSFVYFFVRKSYKGVSSGASAVKFLKYVMSFKGQLIASSQYFSPLPSKVVAINNNGIKQITLK